MSIKCYFFRQCNCPSKIKAKRENEKKSANSWPRISNIFIESCPSILVRYPNSFICVYFMNVWNPFESFFAYVNSHLSSFKASLIS